MSMKVMVVDDDPDVMNLIKTMVEPLGVEVHVMSDSREAAQRVEKEKFDGFLLDARMPHLDGFELTKRVRNSPLNAPAAIVMLTGYNDLETMRQGFKSGISFFLGKPFTSEQARCLVHAMRGAALREKRRHARLPFRSRVACRWGGKEFESTSVNISEGGILLEASGGAALGQEMELEFVLPYSPHPLRLRGHVIRKERANSIGVQFLDLTPEQRETIQTYILGRLKM